ncbi:MAG: peptidoglycan recognition family protein [Phycisphaerales bacterium JB047]
MTHPTPQSDSVQTPALTRRKALTSVAKAGLILGIAGSLSGCNSTAQKRVKSKGGSLGDPIPSDPIAHTSTPTPIITRHDSPSVEPSSSLSAIPSFVIPRSKWTSSGPKRWLADPMSSVSRITVHHDAIMPVPNGSYADSLRRLQAIRNGHLGNGWADIGYHFAIDPSGRIWQARPLELQGAHVKDNNPGNLGIVVFGNYEQIRPTAATLASVDRMLAYAMQRFSVPISRVYTHQELRPTACPGRNLQSQMVATRSNGGRLAQLVRDRSLLNA